MHRVLFICGRNKRRSPTAELVFSSHRGVVTASAGLDADSDTMLNSELLAWADLIFVMEKSHRTRLSRKFRNHLKAQRIVCLDIPDKYEYMDKNLVALLKARVLRHLPPD